MLRTSRALVFGIGLLAPRGGNLRVDLGELLTCQGCAVGTCEKIGFGAEVLHLGFGFRDFLAHVVDFAGEILAGAARLFLPGGLLQLEITVGHGIGDLRGDFWIARLECNRDHRERSMGKTLSRV
jgi:hypothetical protein